MTLIKSISGIRGTIGGPAGDTLNPLDIVKFTSAYATFIRRSGASESNTIVVGRDARISGEMVKNVVCGTLMGMGYDVLNIGLATTPTTELAVTMSGAAGGIIITASHNPRQWNALKLLNEKGEFLTAANGNEVLGIAEKEDFDYADVDHLGKYTEDNTFNKRHIDSVLALKLVDVEAIKNAHFKVCVDSINSVGGVILPELLDALGVAYTFLNGKTLKVWKSTVEKTVNGGKTVPGTIIAVDKTGIHVACGEDVLVLCEVQLEGKKRMETDAFLRGYQVEVGTVLTDHKE